MSDGDLIEKKDTHFDEEEEVRILALWGCSVPLLDVVAGNVNTLSASNVRASRTPSATTTSSPSWFLPECVFGVVDVERGRDELCSFTLGFELRLN